MTKTLTLKLSIISTLLFAGGCASMNKSERNPSASDNKYSEDSGYYNLPPYDAKYPFVSISARRGKPLDIERAMNCSLKKDGIALSLGGHKQVKLDHALEYADIEGLTLEDKRAFFDLMDSVGMSLYSADMRYNFESNTKSHRQLPLFKNVNPSMRADVNEVSFFYPRGNTQWYPIDLEEQKHTTENGFDITSVKGIHFEGQEEINHMKFLDMAKDICESAMESWPSAKN